VRARTARRCPTAWPRPKEQAQQTISATLGGDQEQEGLLAGLIGLGLVAVYTLAQDRALGSVTIAGVVTYGLVVLMGWRRQDCLTREGSGILGQAGVPW
jgi:preprotein translocase subunit SecD